MGGVHRDTGKVLVGVDHLRQSIIDILTTPVGTRVMRRDYGSRLYELVDAPINRSLLVEVYAATAEALARWEPRFILTRVHVENVRVGTIEIALEGEYRPTGDVLRLEGIVV